MPLTPRLAVLQVRSGLLPGEGAAFLQDLLAWAEARGLARLVMLASSHSHQRVDRQLQGGSPLRYIATTALLAAAPPPQSFVTFEEEGVVVPGGGEGVVVPGGGLAARFVRACEEKGVQVRLVPRVRPQPVLATALATRLLAG